MQGTQTVACTLTTDGMSERRRRWHDLAARAFVSRLETEHGLRLVFRSDAGVEKELRELAVLERDCCRFAEWNVTSEEKHAVLDVTGSGDEAVASVQEMFRTLTSSA